MKKTKEEKRHFSFSQFNLYKQDPQAYFEKYVLGIEQITTPKMMKGKIFSEAFADRKYDFKKALIDNGFKQKDCEVMAKALASIPDIGKKNCEVEIRVDNGEMDLLGYFDGLLKDVAHLIENKFGEWVYTQAIVDEMEQLTFYAMLYWLKYGVPPRRISLLWVNARTGVVLQFDTKRSVKQIKEFKKLVDYVQQCVVVGKYERL